MRSLVILILLAGAVAFALTATRTRIHHVEAMEQDEVQAMQTAMRVAELRVANSPRTRVVIHKPAVKKTRRSTSNEPVYSFSVIGTSDTDVAARKDAIALAAVHVAKSLELRKTMPEEAKLEKFVVDTQEKSEGFLGTSDGKDLGEGKQIELSFELPMDYVNKLTQDERFGRMDDRMGWLARGLAVIVAGLFAVSGYVRLDEWSKGYFSGALKLIALLAVIGTGFFVFWVK